MPEVPATISSHSRNKLKSYDYHLAGSTSEDKENNAQTARGTNKTSDPNLNKEGEGAESYGQPSNASFPQTPGSKIAFADLIANPEDALNRQISATPNEQVEWRHVPSSSGAANSIRPSQRGTKRAHSSSPVSSQQQRMNTIPVGQDTLDLESIARSLRTPRRDDPALALWDRYVEIHEQDDQREPTLPPLPPMSSSPHTPGDLRRTEAFRRTASCGIEWPVSATKRRKLTDKDPYIRTKGIFAANKSLILGREHSKHSRVSMLVDVIHQSLTEKAPVTIAAPSSSSPVPERQASLSASPTKEAQRVALPTTGMEDDGKVFEDDLTIHDEDASSDYGGMDIDLNDADLLQVLEQASTQAQLPRTSVSSQPQAQTRRLNVELQELQRVTDEKFMQPEADPVRDPTAPPVVSGSQHSDPRTNALGGQSRPSVSASCVPVDEFDDDDDDAFTTQLAELADKIDSQGPSVPKATGAADQAGSTEQLNTEFADAFDDDDDNEDDELWKAVDSTAVQTMRSATGSKSQQMKDNRAIKRYLIIQVFEGHYETDQGRTRPEKTLSIKDEKTRHTYVIILRQSWYDSRCTKGSYIHLIGNFDATGRCIVDDKNNMIILHPDHLISATVVADSFTCTRRAILQDRIKATNPAEPPQVYGHMLHEVFGEALKQNAWEMNDLKRIIQKLIPTYIESLYEIGVQANDATEYLMSKMPQLKGWACVFVDCEFTPDAVIRDRNGSLVPMSVDKLLELEEHVWSPMYGLKGNIDATVQVQMQLPSDKTARTLTVPLELKTGKRDSNEMHRAQTALYTLLLSDRYDINVTSGVLYYLETCKTFRVEGVRNEIRHMIIQRNELANFVHDKLALPPMIKKEHLCKKCYAQTACFTYHKLIEGGDAESSGLREPFEESVGHLKPSQQQFFRKWDDLITKEERDAMKFRRELWTMISSEREAVGRCFANVVIEPGSATENNDSPKINRYSYSFTKDKPKPGFSFKESQITVGEPIVISDEKGHFALANGYVTSVHSTRVTVAVDRRLQNARLKQTGFHPETNQVFSGMVEIEKYLSHASSAPDTSVPILYRIDKDEFANGMATARNNILRIMEKGLFRARELRQLIIDNKPPVFKNTSTAYTLSGPASQQQLNVDQRNAIDKVMSARDYALVLGMPGTGKTTTIAHIIRALVAQGKSVLLTSYTHTAVDNILLKIKDDEIPILRLGAIGKVHPDVQKFADLSGIPKKTIAELERSWSNSKVVATTCLGINHAIFNHRTFDYCIVDEASQITLPVCLGPIRLASTFILVGDHYQLPPLVQNTQAQEGGLDVSLFKLLSDAQPDSVVNLEHQYRMAEDIMILSNTLVYDGRLKCGNAAVASRLLQIPNIEAALEAHHRCPSMLSRSTPISQICVPSRGMTCWLDIAMKAEHRTLFLNTDDIVLENGQTAACETLSGSGTRITNPIEALLTAQLVTSLVRAGVPPKSVGVITFYRSQLALLKSTIKAMAGTTAASDIEMHTADKYQGRDKEIILLSCVRSNDSCNVGELLKDWRRVNVAITRARSKLVMIGSARTLKGSRVPILEGLIRIVQQRGWLFSLPRNTVESHFFEVSATQTQTQGRVSPKKKLLGQKGDKGRSPRKSQNKIATPVVRKPLGTVHNNSSKRGPKRPAKTANGLAVAAEKLLDKRPILKNILDNEMFVNDENDFLL